MKPIHVLSIGNSFSQDVHRYLHNLARSEGVDIETVNLFIGGCSLERHYRNMIENKKEYTLEINGHRAEGFHCSIDEALTARQWDFITLQQASKLSYQEESFEPYLHILAERIRYVCPKAKLLLHQTWAYKSGSKRIRECGYKTYDEMFALVRKCYQNAADAICADGIIPSGEVLKRAVDTGLPNIHLDTFHASYGIGRFMLSLVWYKYITGQNVVETCFHDYDEWISQEELCKVIRLVSAV